VDAIDIVLLTYNRLEYLVATVQALRERTPEPFRLTIVDNASDSGVRNWLVEHRDLFHQVIFRAENEHIAGFQPGIDATSSDPFVLAEPDLLVPALEPSWLARLHGLMERHPDFGLIGVGLDPANRPSVLGPELIDADALVNGEIVEANVGIWFQMIRRDALRVPYVKDAAACIAIRETGYRVGWAPGIRAFHLGWEDYRRHPAHLASKNEILSPYPDYREVDLIARPPSLEEVAVAAPVAAALADAGVAPESVLELAWSTPALAATLEAVTAVHPPPAKLPLPDGAAGAVVLTGPPASVAHHALGEAFRLARAAVVLVAPLQSFQGRPAVDLAPAGWLGTERPSTGALQRQLARCGDSLETMGTSARFTTLEHRDEWLAFFGGGSFGIPAEERLFVFQRAGSADDRRGVDGVGVLQRWSPLPRDPEPPARHQGTLRAKVRRRVPAPIRRLVRGVRSRATGRLG
jgi:Glycosyl transferase family 2